ncbi:hypothetical protein KKG15_01775 [Patescibacteria group bacterium]|nr:hypothetical protein [Patescibacteria group bacterium]
MQEYFVVTNSNAAPFFSDTAETFIKASSPKEAADKVRKNYKHPAGLFALVVYTNTNAYHKGKKTIGKMVM